MLHEVQCIHFTLKRSVVYSFCSYKKLHLFFKLPSVINLLGQVGLLNVEGYYNSLLSFIDKAVDEGFITPAARHIIISAQAANELMRKLEVCEVI